MKKVIIMLLLTTMSMFSAMAQSANLHISEFMSNDQDRHTDGTKELYVSGSKLKSYNLSFYHSFTLVENNPELLHRMETAVKADGKTAIDKEMVEMGGKLYYAVYTLPPKNGQNRYIFYKNTTLKPGGKNVIVVYMEGKASVEDIIKKFKM